MAMDMDMDVEVNPSPPSSLTLSELINRLQLSLAADNLPVADVSSLLFDFLNLLTPSLSSPRPTSSASLKPIASSQITSFRNLWPSVSRPFLEFLLQHIAVNYLPHFSPADVLNHFDPYFIPPIPSAIDFRSLPFPTKGHVVLPLLLSHLSLASRSQRHTLEIKTALRLLQRLVTRWTVEQAILESLDQQKLHQSDGPPHSDAAKMGVDIQWSTYVNLLCSIPDRIGNLIHNDQTRFGTIETLRDDNFFSILTKQIHYATASEILSHDVPTLSDFLRSLLSKIIRLGHINAVVNTVVPLLHKDIRDGKPVSIWHHIVAKFDPTTLEKFMIGYLHYVKSTKLGRDNSSSSLLRQSQFLSAILNPSSRNGSSHQNLDSNVLFRPTIFKILHQRVWDVNVTKLMVLVLRSFDINSELSILNVFKDSLQLWSDFNFVRYSTYELIKHVSSLFLLTLSFLTPTEICNLRLTTAMLPGVQRYLESSIQDVRKLGMIVAECVSEKVASCEAGKADVKLDFGLVGTDVDVLKKFAIWSNDIFETERNQGKEVECTGSQFGGHSENIEIRAIPEPINQSTLRKDIAFHSDPSASPYLSPNTQKPHLLSNAMDSDDESEDEENLQTYALPKEADRTDQAVPKNIHQRHRYFLRDILNFLKASEDPERIRLGLEYCSQVVAIESSAKRDNVLNMGTGELNELAIDVVGVLLRLENQFHQGEDDHDEGESFDFERRRTEALVSFCCCVNVEVRNRVVEFIGSQFWEPNYNINQRLNMLNILSLSVKQLSDLPSPPSLPTSLTSSSPAATVSSISSAIQASPKQPTTTRRSTKLSQSYIQKQQQTQPVESKLTESAKTFFYPLISRMDYSFSSVLGKREKNVIELVRAKETSLLSSAVEGISLSGQNLEYTNIGLQSGKLDLNVCKPDDGKSGVAEERKATGGLATEGLVLLESLIRSLGIIIYYSAHVPSISTLVRSYWQYLYSLRYHQHSKIQASLVFGFSVIFDIRDGKNLVEDYGEEVANVGAWVNEILQLNQVDKNLYLTSSQLLFQISEAIENYRKAFFGVS